MNLDEYFRLATDTVASWKSLEARFCNIKFLFSNYDLFIHSHRNNRQSKRSNLLIPALTSIVLLRKKYNSNCVFFFNPTLVFQR